MKRTGSIGSMGGAAGDEGAPAAQGRIGAEIGFDRGQDLHRLGHPPDAELAAGEIARLGADLAARRGIARVARLAWVARMGPHRAFIAGAISTGLSVASSAVVARSSASPCAMLGDEVGAGRRHHDQIGLPRQADMAHLALVGEREEIADRPCSR